MADPRRLHVSVSELRAMQTCGQKWYYEYELGRRSAPTPELLRGRVVHEVARTAFRVKRDGGVPYSPDEAMAAAADVFERSLESDGIRFTAREAKDDSKALLGRTKDEATIFAGEHARSVVPFIEPSDVEADITSSPLPELDGKALKGRIDLVAKVDPKLLPPDPAHAVVVRDLKTSKKRPPALDAEGDQQLTVYALLYRMARGVLPYLAKDYLVQTAKQTYSISQFTDRTEFELKATTEALARVERIRMAGIIPPPAQPGSWVCSQKWCGHTAYCPFYAERADTHAA